MAVAKRPSDDPTYKCWRDMIRRCTSPTCNAWKNYGGRGIRVCDRWRDFAAFLADMGERSHGLTLDRINNDGNYEPNNCRWATRAEQRINQRPRKVTAEVLAEIKFGVARGEQQKSIAKRLGLDKGIVNLIAQGKWKPIALTKENQ